MSTLKNGEFGINLDKEKNSLDRPQTPHHLFFAPVLYEVHANRDQTHHPAWLLQFARGRDSAVPRQGHCFQAELL